MGAEKTRRRGRKQSTGPASDAMATGLRLLSIRSRTEQEIHRHLSRRKFTKETIDRTIATLRRLGYVNDEDLAKRYAAWASENRPAGRVRLQADLVRRGVDRNTIDRALEESWGPEQEEAALEGAMRRATRGVPGPLDQRGRMRIMSYLRRRGFSASMAIAAVRAWCLSQGETAEAFDEPGIEDDES